MIVVDVDQKSSLDPFLFYILACCHTCQSVIHYNVCHAVAAQAVGTMKASCHLAGSIESRNRRAIGAQHLCLSVYAQSAHRVMDGRSDTDGIIWCCL